MTAQNGPTNNPRKRTTYEKKEKVRGRKKRKKFKEGRKGRFFERGSDLSNI